MQFLNLEWSLIHFSYCNENTEDLCNKKKKILKNIKKQKEPVTWENLELRLRFRLQLKGKHGSGALRLRAPTPAPGPWP